MGQKMKTKVVVYGGSGFLGSHVSDALTEAGYHVCIYDIKPSPYMRDGQEMVVGDIMDKEKVINAAKDCKYVYNFAGLADIEEAHDNPISTVNLNVLGAVHTLEAARNAGSERYLFASSVYVYSSKGSFYRVSKQSAERYIETYKEVYNLDYTILRYGSLFGRRADPGNFINKLLRGALENKLLTYHGTGEELREYIHVLDAAQSSVKMLEKQFANQHIILTGNEKLRVVDLMKMVSEILGGGVRIEFKGENSGVHYAVTPYAFNPTIGRKFINTLHVDIGQGLIDCLADIDGRNRGNRPDGADWLIKDKASDQHE